MYSYFIKALNYKFSELLTKCNCLIRKGQIYSYCGISDSEVCCFFNDNDKDAVNTTKKESNPNSADISNKTSPPCGVPSVPVNLDSKAVFKEWPWHVSVA